MLDDNADSPTPTALCDRRLHRLVQPPRGTMCERGLPCETGAPSPFVPLGRLREHRTPLRPVPLAMQRSPAWSPQKPASPPVPSTPSKFVPYTGDHYTLERQLGKGAFGLVTLMRSVVTGELVAMKTIQRDRLCSDLLRKTVEREIRILKAVRHGGIVRLLEVIETPQAIHQVLEFVDGGSLLELVEARGRLSEAEARPLVWQLIDALEHCHACHVCHRDLKLENCMLDRTRSKIVLIDFGLSIVWREGGTLCKSYGTPCYMAPEMTARRPYLGPRVDAWSLGVLLAAMLAGRLPFAAPTRAELKRKILAADYTLPPQLSPQSRDFVARLLTVDADARIRLADARQHPWLSPCATAAAVAAATAAATGTGTVGADEGVVAAAGSDAPTPRGCCSSPGLPSPAVASTPSPPQRAAEEGSPPGSPRPTPARDKADARALDATVLRDLATRGLDAAEVSRAVCARDFGHAHACYELLLARRRRDEECQEGMARLQA